jgi:hypothetical protein
MWKYIKEVFVAARNFEKAILNLPIGKKNNFSGFRVELYREGQLIVTQSGDPYQIIVFNTAVGCGPIIFKDGVRCHGYTLTPHLEGYTGLDVDNFLRDQG